MKKKLLELIERLQRERELEGLDEAATKQGVILKILSCLDWDPFDINEVHPEYPTGSGKVDFALRHNGYNKVFIEVKRIGEDLEKHQEQLLNYSFKYGVRIAVLTNGITWRFYLPLHEGSWEQRRFYTIEIYEQDTEDIASKFIDFLSKENVISGKAIENAENIYMSKQRETLIKQTLPKAWDRIVSEPDELLVELIAEITEKMCGYRPSNEVVKGFIADKTKARALEVQRPKIPSMPIRTRRASESYTGKSVSAFTLRGKRYEVKSWKDMLIRICNIVYGEQRDKFERVLTLRGRKKPYFTKNPKELRAPKRIPGTDVYVETNLSANAIVELSRKILSLLGYNENEFSIELH